MSFQNNVMHTDYAYAGGASFIEFAFQFHSDGLFDVLHAGEVVGQGSCLRYQCVYEADFENTLVVETLTFLDSFLHRHGTRYFADRFVEWEEKFLIALN